MYLATFPTEWTSPKGCLDRPLAWLRFAEGVTFFAAFCCFRFCFLWLGFGLVLFVLVVLGLFVFLVGLGGFFCPVAERFSDHRLQYMGIVWL